MGLLVAMLLFGKLVTVEDIQFGDILMMPWWVVFTSVVGTVENTFSPKIYELPLSVVAFEPVEPLVV
jgi:hypothetical protein